MSRPVLRSETSFWEVPSLGTTRKESHWRSGWTSDFKSPKPFTSEHGKSSTYGVIPHPTSPFYYAQNAPSTRFIATHISARVFAPLINGSFDELVSKLKGEDANLLMLLGEGHESLNMIVERLNRLHRAGRALRRGNLNRFLRELRVKKKRKHRSLKPKQVARNASSLWLEYHFGWSPMLNDMYDAAKFLSEPWSVAQRPRAGKSRTQHQVVDNFGITLDIATTKYSVHQGVDAIVSNPNKALVNRLGLANPIYVAWDLLPFSFLVDWITDVGSFLGSLTAFYGYDTRNGFTTHMAAGYAEYWYLPGSSTRGNKQQRCFMYRSLGVTKPLPNLSFFDNVGDMLTKRGLTAVSLLTQVLTGR